MGLRFRILVGMLRVSSRAVGGWLLAAGVLATAVVGACADKKGALMLAITTDMKAPKDVNAVAVSITTNGLVKASFIGRVTPQGDILLPGTLAIVEPDDKNAVIRIRVMAFQNQKPRVIRDVRTTAPPDGRTALLRIPLNFVNDGKVAGNPLPDGLVPDPAPGTESLSPPTSATSAAGGDAGMVGTKELSPSGGDFDFMLNFQPKDCLNPQDETIIDGECKDNYVDSSRLPDFDAAELGDSTGQTGACFDVGRCFTGAIGVGQRPDGVTDAGGDTPADAGSGTGPADAAPKPFKDFRPATVDFKADTCTLQLNGADPARLNIAIVTPDTGECVRPGECYVPIDRGASGWQDDGGGSVQLPSYLCKFLTAKGLRLTTSSDVCAAKLESNPNCTPKPGDDAGISPADGGKDSATPEIAFAIPEDFATSVTIFGSTLLFASASRQGYVELGDPNGKPPSPIQGIAVAGSARLPWRFGITPGGPALVNGTDTGYVLGPQGQSVSIKFNAPIIDVAGTDQGLVWATNMGASMPSFFLTPPEPPMQAEVQVAGVTSLAPTPFPAHVLVGDMNGGVRLCQPQFMSCGPVSGQGSGRVDSLLLHSPTSGYALMAGGIYSITADGIMGTTATSRIVSDTKFAGIQDNGLYFPHAAEFSGSCLVYSSNAGLEYLIEQGGKVTKTAILRPAAAGKPILGVAIGPDPSTGGVAAYYTVFAPREMGPGGGGVYREPLPPECSGVAPAQDGGVGGGGDGGFDAGGPCSPATCPTGCCSAGACVPGTANNACGVSGFMCLDCTALAQTCSGIRTCQ